MSFLKKAFKAVTKPVVNSVKSRLKAVESSISAVKHLAQGDVKGTFRKLTDVAANSGNIATGGYTDFTGRGDGVININAKNYVNEAIGVNKDKTPSTTSTDIQTDGLLQYVSELRSRKARRNRESTNNTNGGIASNDNKLGGSTALGV